VTTRAAQGQNSPRRSIGRRDLARLLAATPPLAAAGCAAAPAPTDACRFDAPNSLTLSVVGNLPFLPAGVNGRAVSALLDTGADRTVVTDALLAEMRMPADPLRRTYQIGSTGRTETRGQVYLPRFRLGSLEIRSQLVSVVPQPAMPGPDGSPPRLVLGADILARHDLDLDGPGRLLTLYPGQPCRLDAPPFPGRSYALPLQLERGKPVIAAEANGHAIEALLDTGANLVQLSRRRARSIGIPAATLDAAPRRPVRGINNIAQAMAVIRLATLRIGPELHVNVPALVADEGPAEFVVGTPWLLSRRLYLSYANQRIIVAFPPGGVGTATT
jgi:clan AA aspartic protease (TIGR02281 family)